MGFTKVKLTRPEHKRQRDVLARLERYLPMLKLKGQQLQMHLRGVNQRRLAARLAAQGAREKVDRYRAVLGERAGVNLGQLTRPVKVVTTTVNVAGVNVPAFREAVFEAARYSLFGTPAWVDAAIADLREVSRHEAELEILRREHDLLRAELVRVSQRVNLFEKVKIPEAREAIRRIRIRLGDEMTAAVGRAKIAKSKIMTVQMAGREEGLGGRSGLEGSE